MGVLNELFFWEAPSRGYSGYQRFFSRAAGIFGVGRRSTHLRPQAFRHKDLTETGNRARKVSGTQGIPRLACTLEVGTCPRRLACTETLLYFSFRSFQKHRSRFIFFTRARRTLKIWINHKTRKFSCLLHIHKMRLLSLLVTQRNERFTYPFLHGN